MAFSQAYVDEIGAALLEQCPLTSQNEEMLLAIKTKVLKYDAEIGTAPSFSIVCNWARPFEQQLQSAIDSAAEAETADRNRTKARRKEMTDYLSGPENDRAEMIRESQARQQRSERPVLKPNINYSPKDIDAMSADEYKTKVLGHESLELNQSRPDEEARKLQEKRMLKTKRNQDTPLRRALRREILEGLR